MRDEVVLGREQGGAVARVLSEAAGEGGGSGGLGLEGGDVEGLPLLLVDDLVDCLVGTAPLHAIL